MGGVNVKNTIVERVLQIVAPHPCSGCVKVGSVLCLDCKYDIINEPFWGCILCGTPQSSGICNAHASPIERAFTVGLRTGVLETVINRLKFQNTKAAAYILADLLHTTLPLLPPDIAIVPIPTARTHVRQRGYDQVELIAYHLSKLRNIPILYALERKTNDTQKTVGREKRRSQANNAFGVHETVSLGSRRVLLLDDVVTTGATLQAAAKQLANIGAVVWVATLAYQPLD